MPAIAQVAALIGVELRGDLGSLSALAGPSSITATGRRRTGAQLRLDLATSPWKRIGLVASPRVLMAPGLEGATVYVHSLAVGLRVR
ncbi:MAG: hypothetical protein MUF00_10080 [Gemmatimonadaceae bacterium]|nr:hypothetical protein [Gemmatimonadaceae bacterium]